MCVYTYVLKCVWYGVLALVCVSVPSALAICVYTKHEDSVCV